jgi:hypothetical protein
MVILLVIEVAAAITAYVYKDKVREYRQYYYHFRASVKHAFITRF